jgi:GT2 family glycosyltransferase
MRFSVASVTVNANGGHLLLRQFRALLAQTRPLDEIIVVDNGSTDGSLELLQQQCPMPTALPQARNLGIGAALSVGLKYALEKGHDWIWLFDHDSQPSPDALEKLLDAFRQLAPAHNIGILSCLPVHRETGTEYHGLIWRGRLCSVSESIAGSGDYFADSVVSSGSLVRAEAVRKAGFPRADFFIDYVDHEFNLRLRRHGYQIAVIRQSVLSHRIGQPQLVKFGSHHWVRAQEPAWRVYYAARNQTITVWHLVGGFRARVLLLLDIFRRVGGILLWDPDKFRRLRLLFMGFRHGIMKRLGESYPPAGEPPRNTIT